MDRYYRYSLAQVHGLCGSWEGQVNVPAASQNKPKNKQCDYDG